MADPSRCDRVKMLAQITRVHEPVNQPEQMICRHMSLKAEAVKQRLLHHGPFTQHLQKSPVLEILDQDLPTLQELFNSIGQFPPPTLRPYPL